MTNCDIVQIFQIVYEFNRSQNATLTIFLVILISEHKVRKFRKSVRFIDLKCEKLDGHPKCIISTRLY